MKQVRREMSAVSVISALIDFSEEDDLSAAVDIGSFMVVGLLIPTIDSGNVTFLVCDTLAGTYQDLKKSDASAVSITAGTGNFAVSADDLTPLAAFRFIKVKTAVAQTEDRTFKFIVKM